MFEYESFICLYIVIIQTMFSDDNSIISFSSDDVVELVSNSAASIVEPEENFKAPNDAIELQFVNSISANWKTRPGLIRSFSPSEYAAYMLGECKPAILYELHNPVCKPFFDFDVTLKRDRDPSGKEPDNIPTEEDLKFVENELCDAIESLFINESRVYNIYTAWRKPAWCNKRINARDPDKWIWKISFRFFVDGLVTTDNDLKAAVQNLRWDVSKWPANVLEGLEHDPTTKLSMLFDTAVYSPRQKLNSVGTCKSSFDTRVLEPLESEFAPLVYCASYYDLEDKQALYHNVESVPLDLQKATITAKGQQRDVQVPTNKELDEFLNKQFGYSCSWNVVESNLNGEGVRYRLVPQDCKCLVDPTYLHQDSNKSAILIDCNSNRERAGVAHCLGNHQGKLTKQTRPLTHKENRSLYINLKKYLADHLERGLFDTRILNHRLAKVSTLIKEKDQFYEPELQKSKWIQFDAVTTGPELDKYTEDLIEQKHGYALTGVGGTGKTEYNLLKMHERFKEQHNILLVAVHNRKAHRYEHQGIKGASLASIFTAARANRAIDCTLMLIDEIGLLSAANITDLLVIKKKYKIIIIGAGDFKKQLTPVDPLCLKDKNYGENEAVQELFDFNLITVTKVHRCVDDRYEEFKQAVEEHGIDITIPIIKDCVKLTTEPRGQVVTYTNKVKECINFYMMDRDAPKDAPEITIGQVGTLELKLKLFASLPLSSEGSWRTKSHTQIYHREIYFILSVDADSKEVKMLTQDQFVERKSIKRNSLEEDFENLSTTDWKKWMKQKVHEIESIEKMSIVVTFDEIAKNMSLAYAVTCHSLIGDTIPQYESFTLTNMNVYKDRLDSWEEFQRLCNTAITRPASLFDIYYLDDAVCQRIVSTYQQKLKMINSTWKASVKRGFNSLKLTDITDVNDFIARFNPHPFDWQTYGRLWTFDHIIPQSSNNPDAFLFKNIQPLGKKEQSLKSDNIA